MRKQSGLISGLLSDFLRILAFPEKNRNTFLYRISLLPPEVLIFIRMHSLSLFFPLDPPASSVNNTWKNSISLASEARVKLWSKVPCKAQGNAHVLG